MSSPIHSSCPNLTNSLLIFFYNDMIENDDRPLRCGAKRTFEPQVHDLSKSNEFLELIFAQSRQHVASVLLEEGRLIGTGGMKNQMIKA